MARAQKVNFFYPTYNFRATEQDPIVDLVRSCLDKHDISWAKAARGSGVSASALHNWANGKTRRPQYATVAAVLGFAGYELVASPRHKGANGAAKPPQVLRRFPLTRSLERAK